ncbi:hypothetical protein I862_07570 [endosymbiont of Acanthamoeba sp. UWC8]|uniref:hypothetical protein n=1 Tax=endosymbiont of Acanthamoeba sp. UWC8 TaxID=86106 RepID=UPI0004D1DF38|nr:hypothetical protein [endosymbiont of Acanthamoeba sp. UWC8]AIF82068.1 hypothetical protein I862_07570 [endosymbiont of Acanthamoeba sp. UWC8]
MARYSRKYTHKYDKQTKSPGDYAFKIAEKIAPESDVLKASFITLSTFAQGAAIGGMVSIFTTPFIGVPVGLLYGSYIANSDKLFNLYEKVVTKSSVEDSTINTFVGLDAVNSGNLECLESFAVSANIPETKADTHLDSFLPTHNDTFTAEPMYHDLTNVGLFLNTDTNTNTDLKLAELFPGYIIEVTL